jgi:pimeloyl-ACP methyl ester carboxylesterase/uncharacterized protein YndB with AHSA1/START domain
MNGATQTDDLVFLRVFDAPRELVFGCMVEPEHLTHFWGPMGSSTPVGTITVDARPGGVFETVMVNEADGGHYPMRAVYDDVIRPERLVWTDVDTGVQTTATFADLGDARTEVRIQQSGVPEAYRSPEAQAGFSSSLDRFAAYLGGLSSVTSADGTTIGYDRAGDGPPVILVMGAFNDRSAGAPLAARLSETLTVINYDRRGRGSSTDTLPYAVDREIDDLEALIDAVGGSASVFGYSSGAVLALRAAARGLSITKLALYDPPFLVRGTDPAYWSELAGKVTDLVSEGRRGDAVELYQTEGIGIPPDVVARIRTAPFWPALEATAHTLAYEALVLACPPELPRWVSTPTLVLNGDAGPEPLPPAARAVADAIPDGELRTLPGQTHDLVPDVLGPILEEFYWA